MTGPNKQDAGKPIFRAHDVYAFTGFCVVCWSIGSWAIGAEPGWIKSIAFGVGMFLVAGVVWGLGWLRRRYVVVRRKAVHDDRR